MNMNLHNQIMNLLCKGECEPWANTREAYWYGHRDARHAAAELAIEADVAMDTARATLADAKDAERYRTLRSYATGNAIEQMLVQSIVAERSAREFDASVDVLILARRKAETHSG